MEEDNFFEDDEPEHENGIDYSEMGNFSIFLRKEWSTFFGPEWEGEIKFKRGMYGRNGKLMEMGILLARGFGIRETSRLTGCSKITVAHLRRVLVSIAGKEFMCKCGHPSGHKGWCSWRFSNSEKRKAFMETWKAKRHGR